MAFLFTIFLSEDRFRKKKKVKKEQEEEEEEEAELKRAGEGF